MKKNDQGADAGANANEGHRDEEGGEGLRSRITSLERACRILHAAEVDLWDTVEHLREGLGAWLSYPDLDIQERAGEMLALIEGTLDRVVHRRPTEPPRNRSVAGADPRRPLATVIALAVADEE